MSGSARRTASLFALVVGLLPHAGLATGQTAPDGRPRIVVSRTDTPPVVDGRLDDPLWQTAARLDQFTQSSPVEGRPPTERTEVWLTYDDDRLYLAFYAHYTDPTIIRANRVDRNQTRRDDWIAVMFDTFLDQQRAYRFSVNGYGVQADAIINAGGPSRGAPRVVAATRPGMHCMTRRDA